MNAERLYKVLKGPHVSEKAAMSADTGSQVVFKVATDANKTEIKAAVEALFGVKVTAVNTLVRKGKVKRFRGHIGQRSGFKKAVVSLEEGHSIDVTTGL